MSRSTNRITNKTRAMIAAALMIGCLSASPLQAKTKHEQTTGTTVHGDPIQVEPGVRWWKARTLTTTGPIEFRIIEADLSKQKLGFFAQPGAGRLHTGQTPLDAEKRLLENGLPVVASINGDFWRSPERTRMYTPVSLHVSNSILATSSSKRSALIIDDKNTPHIRRVTVDAQAEISGKSLPIYDINNSVTSAGPVLFTAPFGAPVSATTTQPLIVLTSEKPGPALNSPLNGTVDKVITTGSITPTPTKPLLRMPFAAEADLPAPSSNITIICRTDGFDGPITQAVGGGPRIVHHGKVTAKKDGETESVGKGFVTARHPRTAVGISENSKKIWFVVADGRRPGYSIGINLPDLAKFMVELGAHEAINLDGGGSSCITVKGELLNWPSDKTPRPVANTIHLLSLN